MRATLPARVRALHAELHCAARGTIVSLALRDAAPEDAAPRIRVAAQACADEKLRVALESLAAEGSDGAIAASSESALDAALARR
jgi:hypothetical protein